MQDALNSQPSADQSEKSPTVYIIIPVHNRKEITLACLKQLKENGDLDQYSVVVVDDGSTDGTAEAIRNQFPTVTILYGDGNLWWTGGIKMGMKYAYDQGTDYFIWLNDDTLPDRGTIPGLLAYCQAHSTTIAASQCYNGETLTYGGQQKTRFSQLPILASPEQRLQCDALDGNLVCIPHSVVDKIGFPNAKCCPHYGGDNLYTWQAKENGFELLLMGDLRAFCPQDHEIERWLMGDKPIWHYWKNMNTPKSPFYWKKYPILCLKYWRIPGIVTAFKPYIWLSVITLSRLLIPQKIIYSVRRRLKSRQI